MNSTSSYLRVIGYLMVAFLLFEIIIDGCDTMAVVAHLIIVLGLLVVLVFSIALETALAARQKTMYRAMSEEAKERYDVAEKEREANRFKKLKAWYEKQVDSKPREKEETILLDHDYDGIKELDNKIGRASC